MSAGILTKLLSRLGRGKQSEIESGLGRIGKLLERHLETKKQQSKTLRDAVDSLEPRNTLGGGKIPPGGSYEALEALDEQAILMFGKRFEELDEVAKREVMEEVMESTAKDIEFNQGGRVGMQTGGDPSYQTILQNLQEAQQKMSPEAIQIDQKSPQVEALAGIFGPHLAQLLGDEIDTSAFAPQAAAQTGLQQAAAQQAATQAGLGTLQFDPTTGQFKGFQGATAAQPYGADATGIAGYQQFLDQAATDLGGASAAAAAGQGAGTAALGQAGTAMDAAQQAAVAGQDAGAQYMGPQAYQQFMSPYQQEVIDATMAGYDQQIAEQQAQLGASAGQAFGGGRFGVAQGQLAADSALGRAQAQANLLQQGYQNAQMAAAQAFGQAQQQAGQNVNLLGQVGQGQLGVAQGQQGQAAQNVGLYGTTGQAQQGLAALQPQLAQQAWAGLGTTGAQQQAQIQAGLDTLAQGAQMAAYEPQQRLGFFGSQLAPMMGGQTGMGGMTFGPATQQPSTSPMSMLLTGIGAGSSIGNLFGGWGKS